MPYLGFTGQSNFWFTFFSKHTHVLSVLNKTTCFLHTCQNYIKICSAILVPYFTFNSEADNTPCCIILQRMLCYSCFKSQILPLNFTPFHAAPLLPRLEKQHPLTCLPLLLIQWPVSLPSHLLLSQSVTFIFSHTMLSTRNNVPRSNICTPTISAYLLLISTLAQLYCFSPEICVKERRNYSMSCIFQKDLKPRSISFSFLLQHKVFDK